MVVAEKRRAYEVWLQRNDRNSYEVYKEVRNRVKTVVRRVKRAADERWGRRVTENFERNKKMFWKEVKRARKGQSEREARGKSERSGWQDDCGGRRGEEEMG